MSDVVTKQDVDELRQSLADLMVVVNDLEKEHETQQRSGTVYK